MQETNRQIDLGTLTLYDSNAIQAGITEDETLTNITDAMIENVKFIFTKAIEAKKNEISLLQSLPEEEQIHDFSKSKLYLDLPQSGIQFPRSFKIPEQKPLTKWERFAKEKNIKKRKKTGMTYDTQTKSMVARWGTKSKKNKFEPAIMDEKQFNRNPFSDEKKKRSLTKEKRKLKELKNIDRVNEHIKNKNKNHPKKAKK